MSAKDHWERVYGTRDSHEFSWFQQVPTASLALLDRVPIRPNTWIIDVGGGDSRFVDQLLDRGISCVTVLDVSGAALARARARLGERAAQVHWIDADVCGDWSIPPVDVWHDRAVFHFLTAETQRDAYLRQLRGTLKSGGSAIFGTFGLDGPTKCSGLPVARYSAETLASTLGPGFTLVDAFADDHTTPSGGRQSFTFARFVRR